MASRCGEIFVFVLLLCLEGAVWHCDHYFGEEEAGCSALVGLYCVSAVRRSLFSLPLCVPGRLHSVIVAHL